MTCYSLTSPGPLLLRLPDIPLGNGLRHHGFRCESKMLESLHWHWFSACLTFCKLWLKQPAVHLICSLFIIIRNYSFRKSCLVFATMECCRAGKKKQLFGNIWAAFTTKVCHNGIFIALVCGAIRNRPDLNKPQSKSIETRNRGPSRV